MKAAVVPAVNGKWEVKDWPTPKAGPNQVLIKIHASGLCYTKAYDRVADWKVRFRAVVTMN